MNIAVVYCYPMVQLTKYYPLAHRFAQTWQQFPPAIRHTLYVLANGPTAQAMDLAVFDGIPHLVKHYGNIGWDIGGYQWAAEEIPCDLLVCLGAYCHFHRSGWLERMVDAWVENGPNLYGCRGYYYGSSHHIRTTSFWLPPALLNSYPLMVGNSRNSRYGFEHGVDSLTIWVEKAGLEALVVTWDGIYRKETWPNYGGNETALVHDQWTCHRGQEVVR